MGSLATLLGPPRALLILAALIDIVVLGISTVVRSLWHSELREEGATEGRGSVAVVES